MTAPISNAEDANIDSRQGDPLSAHGPEQNALANRGVDYSRNALRLTGLGVALLIVACYSLTLGRYHVPFSTWWGILTTPGDSGVGGIVLLEVRLPRILAGILIGAGLSASGAAYQGLFKNPMVSPDILGASAGAGFGAAAAILLGFNIFGIQLASFACGLLAVMLTCAITDRMKRGGDPVLVLILAGIVVGSIFTAFISLTKTVADPDNKLPAITFWLMGSLSSASLKGLNFLLPLFVIGVVPLFLLRWQLNVLSFGEEEASALGLDTRRLRWVIILCATLLTASAVSVAGLIGWVGLVIPHLARMFVGPDYRVLLPASLLMGATYLLLVDDLARSVLAVEISLGILTSLVGAPFFLYLLMRSHKGWA
jgi:iron complex transport system permease protein